MVIDSGERVSMTQSAARPPVEKFRGLVYTFARRMHSGNGPVSGIEDTIQDGWVGAVDAINRYAMDSKSSFVGMRIKGEIVDSARRLSPLSRDDMKLRRMLLDRWNELAQTLQKEPTLGEMASATGYSEADVRRALEFDTVSLEGERDMVDNAALSLKDHLKDDNAEAAFDWTEERIDQSPRLDHFRQVLDTMKPRLRFVLEQIFLNGRTQKDIGEELGISTTRVSQLLGDARKAVVMNMNGFSS